jgi:hypothetical protein
MEKTWERFAKVFGDRVVFGDELVYSKSTQSKDGEQCTDSANNLNQIFFLILKTEAIFRMGIFF